MSRSILLILTLVVLLSACRSSYDHFADADVAYLRADAETDSLGTAADVTAMIAPYKNEMEDQMGTVLGELPEDLVKDRPSSNMGNWFCDALLFMARRYSDRPVDFALQNYGGLRLPFLGKGPVTKSDIYELMPFDNQLMIVELNEHTLARLLDDIADSGGWPVSDGLRFKIENDKAVDVRIQGQAFGGGRIYYIAMPDYIANGWGGQEYLADCKKFNTNVYVRDVLIEYLSILKENKQDIEIDNTKRIY